MGLACCAMARYALCGTGDVLRRRAGGLGPRFLTALLYWHNLAASKHRVSWSRYGFISRRETFASGTMRRRVSRAKVHTANRRALPGLGAITAGLDSETAIAGPLYTLLLVIQWRILDDSLHQCVVSFVSRRTVMASVQVAWPTEVG